ncbi:unnamed protein product, partial [Meganyctiphanes norvegica]
FYNESDCTSTFCHCREARNKFGALEADCTTLDCIPKTPCNGTTALFPHAAPAYLAGRGQCRCYSGTFICQRPDKNEDFSLGPGVYLFIGYSNKEVNVLRDHTSRTVLEALKEMEAMLRHHYRFNCTLHNKFNKGDNLISQASLIVENQDEYMPSSVRQKREKEECAGPLNMLVAKINDRDPEILSDVYLSMFITAEVQAYLPEAQTSSSSPPSGIFRAPAIIINALATALVLLTHHRT